MWNNTTEMPKKKHKTKDDKMDKSKKSRKEQREEYDYDEYYLEEDEEAKTPEDPEEENVEDGEGHLYRSNQSHVPTEFRGDYDNAGFHVIASMSEEDLDQFINILEKNSSLQDTLTIGSRTKKLDWEIIKFGGYTATECCSAWQYLKSQTRKYRIMAEVIQEIKFNSEKDKHRFRSKLIENAPGFPKKPPLHPTALFVREMWKANAHRQKLNFMVYQRECLEGFQRLSESKQNDWRIKLNSLNEAYENDVKEFYKKYPKYQIWKTKAERRKLQKGLTSKDPNPKGRGRSSLKYQVYDNFPDAPITPTNPQSEFIQYKLNEMEVGDGENLTHVKARLTAKWKKLSDRKKVNWINYFVEKVEEYLDEVKVYQEIHPTFIARPFRIRGHLSKEDIQIWAEYNGVPEKPASSVYEMFYKEMLKTPKYESLNPTERNQLASKEFGNLDVDDKELCRINFRRSVIEYKKLTEKFYQWVPDLLKECVLKLFPKKNRSVLTDESDKAPEEIFLEDDEEVEAIRNVEEDDEEVQVMRNVEEHDEVREEYTDFGHANQQSRKKKKKRKLSQDELIQLLDVEPESIRETTAVASPSKTKRKHKNSSEEINFRENTHVAPLINGGKQILKDAPIIPSSPFKNKTKIPAPSCVSPIHIKIEPFIKPLPQAYPEGRPAKRNDMYDVIRGIFDARPHLGRTYSVFYFYAKQVGRESIWVSRQHKNGIVETAKMIYEAFLCLSETSKRDFIELSWDLYEKSGHVNRLAVKNILFPGEPIPPPRNAYFLYNQDVEFLAKQNQNTDTVYPTWTQVGEDVKNIYIKQLYHDTTQYVKDYEDFVMNLNPEDFVTYTVYQSRKWEHKLLTRDTVRASLRGFTFPFSHDLGAGEEVLCGDGSDVEIYSEGEFDDVSRKPLPRCLPRNPLDNDELLRKLTSQITSVDGSNGLQR